MVKKSATNYQKQPTNRKHQFNPFKPNLAPILIIKEYGLKNVAKDSVVYATEDTHAVQAGRRNSVKRYRGVRRGVYRRKGEMEAQEYAHTTHARAQH